MDRKIQQRPQWVKMYEESSDAGFACRRCGILGQHCGNEQNDTSRTESLVWKARVGDIILLLILMVVPVVWYKNVIREVRPSHQSP